MKKLMLAILFFASLASAAQEPVYVFTLKYGGETLEAESLYVTTANYVESSEEGEFTAKIIGFNNETLYAKNFGISTNFTFAADPKWFDEAGNQIVIPERQEITEPAYRQLLLPYFENAKKIEFEKSGEKILEVSVVQFARTCGDNMCQPHESYLTCEADCPSSGQLQHTSPPINYLPLAAGVAAVIAIAVIAYLAIVKK